MNARRMRWRTLPVTARDKKRVQVNERKMTDGVRKLFRRAMEAELRSWMDLTVFDVVNKRVADKDSVMRTRWVLTLKSTDKAKARLCLLEFQDPDMAEVPRDSQSRTFRTGRGPDPTVRGF